MTDLISFTQNAFALYPNADAVDAWADRLLERAAHTEANAALAAIPPSVPPLAMGPTRWPAAMCALRPRTDARFTDTGNPR